MSVNTNKRVLLRREAIARIAPKVKELRSLLGMKQTDMAAACGCSSVQISRWEKGQDLPGPRALLAMAKLAPEDEAGWWVAEAGVESAAPQDADDTLRRVPVLRDAAAAGTPRAVDEQAIDYMLSLPKHLVPLGGKLVGVKVDGDSMSPILETGYVALVDTTQRKASSLVNRMVAARDGDGITIKWLQKQSDNLYLLVPQRTSQRHQVQIMRAEGEWSIVGEVVMWIGQPPPTKRK